MKVTLPDFSQARVLVAGDVMLDRYWVGPADRVSPEAPVPVVQVNHCDDRAGGAANVALNVAALGGQCRLLGLVGEDESAEALRQAIKAGGVDAELLAQPGSSTTTKLRVISRDQQLIRLDFGDHFQPTDALNRAAAGQLAQHQVLVLSDYAKGALVDLPALIASARQAGVTVLVDPKGSDFSKYHGASLLTPNMTEFRAVVGPVRDDQELEQKGQQLLRDLALDALLVTRSKKGMTLLRPGQDALHLPAMAREVYDVTGAGDTVISTLAVALAAGSELPQACALANAAASVVVAKLGTSTVSALELAAMVDSLHHSDGVGVVSENQLLKAVAEAQARGETVVMTNGCFDILHAGHVGYLEQARRLGDRLIVAVNDDDSVRRLKGASRPVNGVEQRMRVLAALGAVDWVVPFSEDTPQRLIGAVLPNLLVKGGDYQVHEIAGHQEVLANGGEVRILGFEDGLSTSAIINTIRKAD
ncbi:bifunctional D-glycero-beta-D-manno-heptose-7-phosphate kinase/D-glycero-beta-D-manno-heptose 1-phosphate adenylyltransferase HldE [Ferrimonas balearica]|uniref:bifunctional D-glycero-beta-D-manno-heptose-7-phosphate kinase/D-glycero-beta-D-manno-heptose 1-phosphate adenylyltransferase HldE n=1 Tax=Ferrimonas balearica TaxID=44012 RepID=UPI001F315C48|nr:bifunctional D-glycero-beta-D-manno-heptose-7-phosphate kinase/D-glycero-beta-D-manno-heptose 1-phosphate adenylyltransferase HldE [Ferrimonas balearica]MBY6018738.1 bifunctional D-glycero-beta-D-manno-heptose-7-phosphate kinase/D-glycero-beta-D-manno-heptose 1-phosphate adenylyltransferase HldE [Halomonas denitrificans]MBY6095928.1 bifunctional D-glycero-beta-D-manno-heptose-7-phosphate kinase/D-glycero-beta-D-manno-heptose 1-phosphate adenylyltransferase HldE [Ferrimonas balearica]